VSGELSAIAAIGYRDLLKFLRDRTRLVSSLVFPAVFIAILGGSLQGGFGGSVGFSFIALTFTGIFAQTLFQSSAMGIISLIEDRENDFSQEMFVSPISRYSILFGKIVGESMVAMVQGVAVILFAMVLGVSFTLQQALLLIPVAVLACLLGGAFGAVIMANLGSQRAANQVFPFVMLPQFFLAGVFAPIQNLPIYLAVVSYITPMRYAVDLARGVYYQGRPEYDRLVLMDPLANVGVIAAMFTVFIVLGTAAFVRQERNR
jgi:ABC-2 type transport system permease protein